jgi:DNA polymerase-3 subunit delta'
MHSIYGHHEARRRLALAVAQDRLPQVILITGPAGVGKQRLALWLGQLLLCESPADLEPCGQCRSCRLVTELKHPDLNWFVPILRPKKAASDPDKQIEEAAEILAQVMEDRRENPLYSPPDGMAIHGVASARLILRKAALTPVEGAKKVFLVGDADRLVPQESSPEAANALLKLLEEPPANTVLVLTTVDANRLLPTVRSRAAPLRLRRLPDDEVKRFLNDEASDRLDTKERESRTRRAGGSIGQAVREEDDAANKARVLGRALLEAALDRGSLKRLEGALAQNAWSARGDFTAMLDAMAEALNDAAREALGHRPVAQVFPVLQGRDPEALVKAASEVRATREAAQGNVNPQLLIASLGATLSETL